MPKFIDHVKVFVDGGSRGNPGPAAIGVLILDGDKNVLCFCADCIGTATNNQAEYHALIWGLSLCAGHTRRRVTCYSDSELVVKQMIGHYRLKNKVLLGLFQKVKQCEGAFVEVVYQHVVRTNPYIRKVDRILNEALEGR